MNFIKILSSFSLVLFSISSGFSQWKYETSRKITKDVIINYSVSYEKELTEEQKKSSRYIHDIILILKNNKLVEKKLGYKSVIAREYSIFDYNKNVFYKCNNSSKHAISNSFKDPSIISTLQKGESKKIAGIQCEKYLALLKGKYIELYSTKKLGLKYTQEYNVQGLLMEYSNYDKYLGFYKVKAEKISLAKLPQSTYSLDGFTILTQKEYDKSVKEYQKERKVLSQKRSEKIQKIIGKESPKFYMRTIKNKKLSSKKMLENKKVVVLNFWFTTCPPCKAEIPKLNALRKQYTDNDDIEFIAIATDDKNRIERFLKQHPINYDIVEEGRYIASKFDITAYPTNIIIDKKGIIQFYEIGYKSGIKTMMTNKIDELLDQ